MYRGKKLNRRYGWMVALAVSAVFSTHCGNYGSGGNSNFDSKDNGSSGGPFGGTFGGGGSPLSGSSGLTQADQTALQNAANANAEMAPQQAIDIPSDLLAQAKEYLSKSNTDPQVATQRVVLAGKMIQACVQKMKSIDPINTHLGKWKGKGCENISFTVTGSGASGRVSGGLQGTLTADGHGGAALRSNTFNGSTTDSPTAARGSGRRQKEQCDKEGCRQVACDDNFVLQQSTNPNPQILDESMKQFKVCLTQVLALTAMSSLFEDMGSSTSSAVLRQLFGIQ